MPRMYHRAQLGLHIKRALCAHHVENPQLRHVDLARWCFTRFGVRPDRSTVGRVLKNADRWRIDDTNDNAVRVRGGAYPELEQAMARWIARAGPPGVPLTLATIRDHVAYMARENGAPATFRCSIGPRGGKEEQQGAPHRGLPCQRGRLKFRPLVISKARRPHDFRPDYDPEELCYWRTTTKGWMTTALFTHFIEQLDAAKFAEGRQIVILMDNASSHTLTTRTAVTEDLFGFRTRKLENVRIVYLPPNTTCFTQPLDQGLIAMAKARYRAHWLRKFTGMWAAEGATSAAARFRLNLRDVIAWLSDAWMNIPPRTIQRCWWRTGCLPRVWAMELAHVGAEAIRDPDTVADIGLDGEVNDVGLLIDRLCLGSSAMAPADFVAVDDNQPCCAEPGDDPLAMEPRAAPTHDTWAPPSTMQEVYDDANPASCEARRTARLATEMLIGYAKATCVTPRDLCALFDIRNPIIRERMERASPPLNLNMTPPPAMTAASTPEAEAPRRRGRVLPARSYPFPSMAEAVVIARIRKKEAEEQASLTRSRSLLEDKFGAYERANRQMWARSSSFADSSGASPDANDAKILSRSPLGQSPLYPRAVSNSSHDHGTEETDAEEDSKRGFGSYTENHLAEQREAYPSRQTGGFQGGDGNKQIENSSGGEGRVGNGGRIGEEAGRDNRNGKTQECYGGAFWRQKSGNAWNGLDSTFQYLGKGWLWGESRETSRNEGDGGDSGENSDVTERGCEDEAYGAGRGGEEGEPGARLLPHMDSIREDGDDEDVILANELEEIDKEVVQEVFNRVSLLRAQVQHYRALGGFVLLMALFVAMVYLQADSSRTYQVTAAHSVLIPSNFAPDSSNRFAGAADFYAWLNNSIIENFWQDPPCGDGLCDQPLEFPAFGRFGCEADCGTFPNLTSVSVHFTTSFSSSEALAVSSWNLCMQSPISLCWHALPQPFPALHAQFSLALDIPDGHWALLITAPMGGVQGVLQAQKPGLGHLSGDVTMGASNSVTLATWGGCLGGEGLSRRDSNATLLQDGGDPCRQACESVAMCLNAACGREVAAREVAGAFVDCVKICRASPPTILQYATASCLQIIAVKPSLFPNSLCTARDRRQTQEAVAPASPGPGMVAAVDAAQAAAVDAAQAAAVDAAQAAAVGANAGGARWGWSSITSSNAAVASTNVSGNAGGNSTSAAIADSSFFPPPVLRPAADMQLPHLAEAPRAWELLGSTEKQRVRALQVAVSRAIYTMVKDSCLAGPYMLGLSVRYRLRLTAFLCTLLGGPVLEQPLCRFANSTGQQLLRAQELFDHLKQVHRGVNDKAVSSQQLRRFIDILIAALQSVTTMPPQAAADLSAFFHRFEDAIVSTDIAGCSQGGTWLQWRAGVKHNTTIHVGDKVTWVWDDDLPHSLRIAGMGDAPTPFFPGFGGHRLAVSRLFPCSPMTMGEDDDYDDPVPCVLRTSCHTLSPSPSLLPLSAWRCRLFPCSPLTMGEDDDPVPCVLKLPGATNATFTYTKVFTQPGTYHYESGGQDAGEVASSAFSSSSAFSAASAASTTGGALLPPAMSGMVTVLVPPPEAPDPAFQCSPGCSMHMLADGVCNPPCNTPACTFDGGDCGCIDSVLGPGFCACPPGHARRHDGACCMSSAVGRDLHFPFSLQRYGPNYTESNRAFAAERNAPLTRFVGQHNRLLIGIFLYQERWGVKTCNPDHLLHLAGWCSNGTSREPFGVNPHFLPSSSLYDPVAVAAAASTLLQSTNASASAGSSASGAGGEHAVLNPQGLPYGFEYPVEGLEGYPLVFDINLDHRGAENRLQYLVDGLYIDNATRKLEVSFITHNGESSTFVLTRVTAVVDTGGGLVTSFSSLSVPIDMYSQSLTSVFLLLLQAVYVLALLWNGVEEAVELRGRVKREGSVLSYFRSGWNWIDLASLLLQWLALITWIVLWRAVATNDMDPRYDVYESLLEMPRYWQVAGSGEGFKAAMQEYEDLQALINWRSFYFALQGVNLFFLMVRLLKLMDFQPYLGVITRSLALAMPPLLHFFLLAFVVFFCFSLYGYLVFGAKMEQFATLPDALFACFLIILNENATAYFFAHMHGWDLVAGMLFFIAFILLLVFILFNFLIAIIVDAFMTIKETQELATSIAEDVGTIVRYLFCRLTGRYASYSSILHRLQQLGARDFAADEARHRIQRYRSLQRRAKTAVVRGFCGRKAAEVERAKTMAAGGAGAVAAPQRVLQVKGQSIDDISLAMILQRRHSTQVLPYSPTGSPDQEESLTGSVPAVEELSHQLLQQLGENEVLFTTPKPLTKPKPGLHQIQEELVHSRESLEELKAMVVSLQASLLLATANASGLTGRMAEAVVIVRNRKKEEEEQGGALTRSASLLEDKFSAYERANHQMWARSASNAGPSHDQPRAHHVLPLVRPWREKHEGGKKRGQRERNCVQRTHVPVISRPPAALRLTPFPCRPCPLELLRSHLRHALPPPPMTLHTSPCNPAHPRAPFCIPSHPCAPHCTPVPRGRADVFDRVSFLRAQVQHYRALGGFVLLMALFVAMVYLQADSSRTYQVTSAHSVLIPSNFAPDSSNRFAGAGEFYSWLNESIIQVAPMPACPHQLPAASFFSALLLSSAIARISNGSTICCFRHPCFMRHYAMCQFATVCHTCLVYIVSVCGVFPFTLSPPSSLQQFWQDPPCGDGTCDQPFEFPAFGRFGCEADCGTFPNLTSVSIHFTTSFSSPEALAWSSWNLCMQSPISLCWHALPQPFPALHAQFSLALDIPDGHWALLITAPMGGVQGVLQAQKPGMARLGSGGSEATTVFPNSMCTDKASSARRKARDDAGDAHSGSHARGHAEEVHGTRHRFHQSRHRAAADAHAAAVEAAATAAHRDGSAHENPVPSYHATSYHSSHHGASYHESHHGSAAYHGSAYHGSAFHASSLQGPEQYHEHAAHTPQAASARNPHAASARNPHAASAYHSHAAMPGLSASAAATADQAAAVGAVGVGGDRMVQAADLSEETLDLPHLSTAANVWTLLGSTDAQRIRNLQVAVSRTLYTMIKDSCLAGPYAMTLTETYRRKFTAFLCTIFGGPAEQLELCRFRNATGNQLLQPEELYRHLKKVHLGGRLVITSQQLRRFIDILLAAMQSVTALTPDALADLSAFFHRLDPAIVSTSTEGCSQGGTWLQWKAGVKHNTTIHVGDKVTWVWDDDLPHSLRISGMGDGPKPFFEGFGGHRLALSRRFFCSPMNVGAKDDYDDPVPCAVKLASDVNATFTYTKVFNQPGVYLYESGGNDVGEIGDIGGAGPSSASASSASAAATTGSSSMSGMVTVLVPPPEPKACCVSDAVGDNLSYPFSLQRYGANFWESNRAFAAERNAPLTRFVASHNRLLIGMFLHQRRWSVKTCQGSG
ncbi:unnamed protein product, partial [Closterium sp. Yama58-4]